MSQTKLLLEVVQDIQALGNSLQALSEALLAGETEQVAVKDDSTPSQPTDVATLQTVVTLEAVRAVLAKQSQAGFTAQVQDIIQRFKVKKLSF